MAFQNGPLPRQPLHLLSRYGAWFGHQSRGFHGGAGIEEVVIRSVLTCSALKRSYRDQLRAASPGLRFAFLDITRAAAAQRVAARSSHFFSASLVDSQFATLESPLGEPGVLRLDAELPLGTLQRQVQQWLQQETTA